MRIVFLNPCANLGGTETSLLELLAALRSARPAWELSLIAGGDGPLLTKAAALNVRVIALPFPESISRMGDAQEIPRRRWPLLEQVFRLGRSTPAFLGYVHRLRSQLRKLRPHIVHASGFKMHLLGAWSRPRESRLVWHVHDYVSSRPVMRHLVRLHSGACRAVFVNSLSVAADLRSFCPVGTSVLPIYNAVDVERFSPVGSVADLDALAGLPQPSEPVIRVGLPATFARWKGHITFLRAIARIPRAAAIRGYIIGGPIYDTQGSQYTMEELRAEADRLGVMDRVGFTGFIQDVPGALRALDIVTHASTRPEPFGMVIAEAMACGRPVIVSRAGGALEIFREGENALGHEPGDDADLARQISRLAAEPETRRRLGDAGRAHAAARFHRGRLSREILAAYASLFRPGEAAPGILAGDARGIEEEPARLTV
jgi:glycosyltransferase involved in cell wall biosynthesis